MGIMVYSLLWVMQDFVHQPYFGVLRDEDATRWGLCVYIIMSYYIFITSCHWLYRISHTVLYHIRSYHMILHRGRDYIVGYTILHWVLGKGFGVKGSGLQASSVA